MISKKSESKGNQKKPQTQKGSKQTRMLFQFNRIKYLKSLRQKFEVLPNQANYQISNQPQYLRVVTQILQNITKIRLQEIQYIVSEDSFKKILVQLNNLTAHKQIVLSLLKELLKGVQSFVPYLAGDLYQILLFMVQIDGLSVVQVSNLNKEADLNVISKIVLSLSVLDLIQSIEKWYFLGSKLCALRDKYSKLKQALKKRNICA